ncbi:MAG: N-acetylglucosamine-6-phosphate deacetylase [Deltaproteobacteria bacterium]|nr:N-acetylglucosamine-6-phosphate deacetylase [Deltaproteobacteria bacterium]
MGAMAGAGRIELTGITLAGGDRVALVAENGRWTVVAPAGGDAVAGAEGLVWHPGALDPHINGWGGCDFLLDDPADHAAALATLTATGTTAFLPTLISCDEETLRAALARWQRWQAAPAVGAPRFCGLHLEGPFLAPERAGVHPREFLRAVDPVWLGRLLDDFPGLVRLVTVAPELPGAIALVAALARRWVTVGLGHTAASVQEVRAAVAAGARWVTHLFNAMAPFHHRAPGVVGAALGGGELTCEVIADGLHVAPEGLAIAYRCLGPGRLVVVSDGLAAAGMGDTPLRLGAVAGAVAGVQAVDSEGRLAGGLASVWEGAARLAAAAGVRWEEVVPCVRTTAAHALRLDLADRPRVGEEADLVGLDPAGRVVAVLRAGQWRVAPPR